MAILEQRYLDFLHRWEGGFKPINDPVDRGGYTNNGVTLARWKTLAPKYANICGTEAGLAKLTVDQWRTVVLDNWVACGADRALDPRVAVVLAELNWAWPGNMRFTVQRFLNQHGSRLIEDGVIGPRTLQAINSFDTQLELAEGLVTHRWLSLMAWVRANKEQRRFQQGWANRTNDLLRFIESKFRVSTNPAREITILN